MFFFRKKTSIGLEAIAIRWEATASRLEAIALRKSKENCVCLNCCLKLLATSGDALITSSDAPVASN